MESENRGRTANGEGSPQPAAVAQPADMEVDEEDGGIVSSDEEIDYSIKPEFYNPNLDDRDELWVTKQRIGRDSDAVLSCPACFTTLCLESQRHEKYVTQYRAMFVRNCSIKKDKALKQETPTSRRSKHTRNSDNPEVEMVSWPVCCSVCSTEVGVFDHDGIYHFFDVLPSN